MFYQNHFGGKTNIAEKFWSKQAIQELVKEHQFQSVEQIQTTMKEMFKDVLETTLKAELDTQLAYAPYDQNKETKNSRNGYRQKTVHTEYGDLPCTVPCLYVLSVSSF